MDNSKCDGKLNRPSGPQERKCVVMWKKILEAQITRLCSTVIASRQHNVWTWT